MYIYIYIYIYIYMLQLVIDMGFHKLAHSVMDLKTVKKN